MEIKEVFKSDNIGFGDVFYLTNTKYRVSSYIILTKLDDSKLGLIDLSDGNRAINTIKLDDFTLIRITDNELTYQQLIDLIPSYIDLKQINATLEVEK